MGEGLPSGRHQGLHDGTINVGIGVQREPACHLWARPLSEKRGLASLKIGGQFVLLDQLGLDLLNATRPEPDRNPVRPGALHPDPRAVDSGVQAILPVGR